VTDSLPAEHSARRGALFVAAAALCWSSGGLIVRLVSTDPWTTSLWRSSFAALFLAVVLHAVRGRWIGAQWREGGRPVFMVAALLMQARMIWLPTRLSQTRLAGTFL